MPRPIIGIQKADTRASANSKVDAQGRSRIGPMGPQLQHRLRQKRSKSYLETISKLDVGVYQGDRAALGSLMEAISNEFPDLGIDQMPLGIVSRCYLGAPFEVHICDLAGAIINHYEKSRSMPAPFERARRLAIHPAYALVEVYSDVLRAVGADGSVSVIEE